MSWLIAITLFASGAEHCDGMRVTKKGKNVDAELGEAVAVQSSLTRSSMSSCYNIAGTHDWVTAGRRRRTTRGVETLTQSGCSGKGEGWTFSVSGTSLTTGSGERGTIRPGPPLKIFFPETNYNYTRRAGSGPPVSGGLTFDQFMEWMAIAPAMGGYACGYAHGWCGCACGNNQNKTCSLPRMPTGGTEGGRTCGSYGVTYGCAEAWNTLVGCPLSSR